MDRVVEFLRRLGDEYGPDRAAQVPPVDLDRDTRRLPRLGSDPVDPADAAMVTAPAPG